MNEARFDDLTRWMIIHAPRRAMARGLGASVIGAALGVPGLREAAARKCKKKGKKCKKAKDCCSGICKGKKDKRKCKTASGARGCTIEAICGVDDCPDFPGSSCGVTVHGKPFCFTAANCFACTSDAHCVSQFGPGRRCISCPNACGAGDDFRGCARFTPG